MSGAPKFLTVARQEFLNGIRSKWFIIGTIVAPVLMFGLAAMAILLAIRGGNKTTHIIVLDETRTVFVSLKSQFTEKFEDGSPKIQLEEGTVNSLVDVEQALKTLRENVIERDIDGYIHVPKDFLTTGEAKYFALSVSNFELNTRVQMALSMALRQKRLTEAGLEAGKIAALVSPASLETFRVSEEGDKADRGGTFGLVYVLVILLYSTVVLYGATICRSIVEEKVSRIVEVMLAAVKPFHLLTGKVIGVGLVGLCQLGVWAGLGMVMLNFRGPLLQSFGAQAPAEIPLPDFPLWLAMHFGAWFLLGYFLFAILYALVASLAGTEQEAQQLQFPIVFLLMVPLMSMAAIIQHPESNFSVVMSMIPFFSPIVMFMRTAVLMPPWHQIAASMGICVLTILLMLWLVAKIYRIGILSYGKRPGLGEVVRWIFSS